jgi:hypothetical protein
VFIDGFVSSQVSFIMFVLTRFICPKVLNLASINLRFKRIDCALCLSRIKSAIDIPQAFPLIGENRDIFTQVFIDTSHSFFSSFVTGLISSNFNSD